MSQPEHRHSLKYMEYLRRNGAWCFKVHGGPMQPSGIPDIIGVLNGVFFGVESKEPGNSTSDIQDFRISRIRQAGGLVVVAYAMTDVQQFVLHVKEHHHGEVSCDMDKECPYGAK